jgi:hypothetical protein
LEKSLRADIESYVGERLSGFKEELERLREQLTDALAHLSKRLDEPAASPEAPLAIAVADHLRNARNLGIEAAAAESTRARASSDIALIKAAVDELDAQHTQADVLNALVNRSAAFAPRIAFFVVKNERATGWRARGLAGTVGDDAVRELSLPLQADTLLGEVARTRSTWAGEPGSHAEDHTIYQHFGGEPPQRMIAIPLVAREKSVAVLYADSAGQDADAVNLEALETLVRVAGMSVELLAARRPSASAAERSAAARPSAAQQPAPQPQREESTSPQASEQERQPSAFEPQPIAAAPQSQPEAQPESQPEPEPEPQHSFDAQPAPSASFEPAAAAPAQAEGLTTKESAPAVSPLGASRRYGAMDMDFPVEVAEEDKRFHNEARRFARLLVSEIKLYNEQKVREGRDAGDLYERLREDIDRSRQMYDKRVRPEVSGRYDYFHSELVNMLAEGDAAKLGADYPGATAHA